MNRTRKLISCICCVVISTFIFQCAIPSESELEISIFDKIPDISSNVSYEQGADSIKVTLNPKAEHGNLEFAYSIRLDNYNDHYTTHTAYGIDRSFVIRGLSDNLKNQQWRLAVLSRYPKNGPLAATFDILFTVECDKQSIQLSPSHVIVNPLHNKAFYIDVNLDDISDSIHSGEFNLHFDNECIELDTIVYGEFDSTNYLNPDQAQFVNFTKYDSRNRTYTLTFAFYEITIDAKKVNGVPGSGKIMRLFFTALKTGDYNLTISNGMLRNIYNKDVAVGISGANVHISYMEN